MVSFHCVWRLYLLNPQGAAAAHEPRHQSATISIDLFGWRVYLKRSDRTIGEIALFTTLQEPRLTGTAPLIG